MDGPRVDSRVPKAHIIAVSAPAESFAETLSKHTTRHAYTLASRYPGSTPKSCPHNGSSKSALVRESSVRDPNYYPQFNTILTFT